MADFVEKLDGQENYRRITINTTEKIIFPKMVYKDYKIIPDDIRCELIDGVIYMMASADEMHQWISGELFSQLKNQLQGKKCTPYSEFDVRLFYTQDESDVTVVRPDIIVVCDEIKVIGKKYCEGPPNFIIEIMSDSSKKRDFENKKLEYEKAGVKEYWIAAKGVVHCFLLSNNEYSERIFNLKDSSRLKIYSLEGCYFNFNAVVDRYT
jgi:Uma2 family endonuclease